MLILNPMKIYNTLTKRKDQFRPIHGKRVGIYTCGPTVYDVAHIGNLRAYVVADTLVRLLQFLGYQVKWVVNITDIDDKTIAGAHKAHKSLKDFTAQYEERFYEDLAKLNIQKADVYPKATEHFGEMRELVTQLTVKQFAYETKDGIYFDISKFPNYGKLSGLDKRELKPGARVDVDSYDKQSPGDFALWKKKEDRPGWHIECSAMSRKHLGQPFDIHTGGVDLIFPHHENEIAQSLAAFDKPLANYFVHNEHLLVEGKKMAKSQGNYITLDTVIEKGHDPLALRYLFLQTHYRDKMNFTGQALGAAEQALNGIRQLVQRNVETRMSNAEENVNEVLQDDLNTPKALGLLHEAGDSKLWLKFDAVLGLGLGKTHKPLKLLKSHKTLIEKREQLRKQGKFEEADKIRQDLAKQGIRVEDTPEGPRVLTD